MQCWTYSYNITCNNDSLELAWIYCKSITHIHNYSVANPLEKKSNIAQYHQYHLWELFSLPFLTLKNYWWKHIMLEDLDTKNTNIILVPAFERMFPSESLDVAPKISKVLAALYKFNTLF